MCIDVYSLYSVYHKNDTAVYADGNMYRLIYTCISVIS